ncbi:bifunctional demethylmenaquinone methyltransferase/2-methoxy-6-polyprenyl-1,4-benzoquinol methylase UbiE [Lyngbya confervoides]|uniref:2-phytyl-1,4-naphtoquinone methyltransferase n=1 Tax=Lyngbya confervoides BDU141951 TaxID=1574623 RepID=A0ABD4T6L3_9CYAN|nr:bifunctional demethylmenaquinone methyltransferase/2-methoxy-6-polyprenyl-1,4-benzoquinol methylase UbiE [Lyngbya confervoides]MCM1984286.1 bifunctional demethylmenaquinone methyltransferase/2-methoxy-6-polyprenyl-1,4-benzoquinol methylase UbiE [Lyngbya confervoides BDU141951]
MAAPSSAQVQRIFDQIAPIYDPLNDWLSLGQHRIWKQMTVNWSGAQPGDRVLDLCCGSGDLTQMLARQVGPTGWVTGLDFSAAQLANAQRRVAGKGIARRITWQLGDAVALPYPDLSFDAITMGYGLRNVVNIPQALREIHRVLKPGARAAILDFCHSDHAGVQQVQRFFLNQLVVPLATRFGCESEYAYIEASIERFPLGREQESLAQAAGFAQTTYYLTALGLMGVLVCQKASPPGTSDSPVGIGPGEISAN